MKVVASASSENWKPVIGYEGFYEVSNHGRVRSLSRKIIQKNRWGKLQERISDEIIMSPTIHHTGYPIVSLRKGRGSKKIQKRVHRLVAEAFLGDGKNLIVNHKNLIRHDNHIDNLEWTTIKGNASHAIENGRYRMGENHPNSKLNKKIILEIVERVKNKETYKKIAGSLSLSKSTIWRIVNKKGWKHLGGDF